MLKQLIEKHGLKLILALFILMGMAGIFYNFSLAYTVGDETSITSTALKMIADFNFRPNYPTFYYFPLAVYVYLPFIALLLLFFRVSGLFTSISQIKEFGIIDYAKILPFSRCLTVLVGALSIYLTFRIAEKLFKNRYISLLAALLLASSLMLVEMSHFARVWVPQVFFILLAFNYLAYLLDKEKIERKNYIIAGLLMALSWGVHTIGVLVYFSFLCLLFIRRQKTFTQTFLKNGNFWLVNLIMFISLPIIYFLNPYAFGLYSSYYSGVADQTLKTAGQNVNLIQGAVYYFRILVEYEPLLVLTFLLSLPVLYRQKRKAFYLLGSFILAYYIVIGFIIGSDHSEPRYILPIIPFLAIISAYGIFAFIQARWLTKKIRVTLVILFLIINLIMPVIWCLKIIKPSTRLMAMAWIYDNVDSNSQIINLDSYLTLNENRLSIEAKKKFSPNLFLKKDAFLLTQAESDYPKPDYYVVNFLEFTNGLPKELQQIKYQYAILTWSNQVQRQEMISALTNSKNQIDSLAAKFSDDLSQPDFDIAGNMRQPYYYLPKLNYTGPNVEIYKLKD